jgi:pimeloyl-ACP methyl ester carboxylesterase
MTDQFSPDAPSAQVNGSAPSPVNGFAPVRVNGSAVAASSPIPHWPGELVKLDIGAVFVRTAPADPDSASGQAVYVHGLGGSATNWTDLMGLLSRGAAGAPGLEAAAIDLPGFGFSPPPADGDYSVDARAAAVISLIERLGNWPVHLVGNSLGGAVSTRIAARRPDLVRTLTLISPALPDLRPRPLPIRLALIAAPGLGVRILKRFQQIPPERRTDMTINDLYADPSLLHRDRRAEAVAEVIRRDGLDYAGDAMVKSGRALVSEYTRPWAASLWRDAARVTAPTLVIHGSHDRLVNPMTAARAARSFRYGRVVVLPRIGHVAMMERPELVAAEMQQFIAAAGGAESGPNVTIHRVGG